MECWNDWCILTDCDGVHHGDPTGYSWEQARGTQYNPESGRYDRKGDE